MQVASKTIPYKQTNLERQAQSSERNSAMSSDSYVHKTNVNEISKKGSERNETSQYLKVLSRIENLLYQEKLPDEAVEGFVGAIKKQIDLISEDEKQKVLKLPEAENLELKNLNELPKVIKSDIRDKDKLPILLKFLKLPKFAELMQTEGNPSNKTYVANPSHMKSNKASEINVLKIPTGKEKQSGIELTNSSKKPSGNRTLA